METPGTNTLMPALLLSSNGFFEARLFARIHQKGCLAAVADQILQIENNLIACEKSFDQRELMPHSPSAHSSTAIRCETAFSMTHAPSLGNDMHADHEVNCCQLQEPAVFCFEMGQKKGLGNSTH